MYAASCSDKLKLANSSGVSVLPWYFNLPAPKTLSKKKFLFTVIPFLNRGFNILVTPGKGRPLNCLFLNLSTFSSALSSSNIFKALLASPMSLALWNDSLSKLSPASLLSVSPGPGPGLDDFWPVSASLFSAAIDAASPR